MLTIGQSATLACLLEVNAPKPGNVHRGADFDDATLNDFAASAVAIGPVMERAASQAVGQTVLDAIQATDRVTQSNTNLGIVLLFAPIATVAVEHDLEESLPNLLDSLSARDATLVYQAVRQANPGGLDPVDEPIRRHDIHTKPPDDLIVAMRAAADRDTIAKQYVNGFQEVFQRVIPYLLQHPKLSIPDRIVHAHLQVMSQIPDTLIARKGGGDLANESAARATAVLEAGDVMTEDYQRALAELDFWLRSDGRRRNPGTTADLIAAGLFVLLRENKLQVPFG
ncbi:MAG: triphosphoribosyl-dephospho-CoA synthetase [Planctomycetaceae bacterium]|nr:triphosphoribosyl-dephospho-CoA synthetase [Planctomycetaceae bacterium]